LREAYSLVIASAPVVPNLKGDTQAGARLALQAAGLVAGRPDGGMCAAADAHHLSAGGARGSSRPGSRCRLRLSW
jgi:hypothetical protein